MPQAIFFARRLEFSTDSFNAQINKSFFLRKGSYSTVSFKIQIKAETVIGYKTAHSTLNSFTFTLLQHFNNFQQSRPSMRNLPKAPPNASQCPALMEAHSPAIPNNRKKRGNSIQNLDSLHPLRSGRALHGRRGGASQGGGDNLRGGTRDNGVHGKCDVQVGLAICCAPFYQNWRRDGGRSNHAWRFSWPSVASLKSQNLIRAVPITNQTPKSHKSIQTDVSCVNFGGQKRIKIHQA
jgi:hypothetical protein